MVLMQHCVMVPCFGCRSWNMLHVQLHSGGWHLKHGSRADLQCLETVRIVPMVLPGSQEHAAADSPLALDYHATDETEVE